MFGSPAHTVVPEVVLTTLPFKLPWKDSHGLPELLVVPLPVPTCHLQSLNYFL